MTRPLATVSTDSVVSTAYHIPTGNFLPSGRGRGFTHDEPTPVTSKPPRLFTSRRGAHLALRAWLAGKWKEEYTYDFYNEVDSSYHDIEPSPDRKASEMEIFEISLSIASPGAACDPSCGCGLPSKLYHGEDMIGDDTPVETLRREWEDAGAEESV
jgi:hypothetical protein